MSETQRLLVPLHEAREYLGGIGRTMCYDLIDAGELVRVKLGQRAFITMDSIRELVERRTQQAQAAGANVAP